MRIIKVFKDLLIPWFMVGGGIREDTDKLLGEFLMYVKQANLPQLHGLTLRLLPSSPHSYTIFGIWASFIPDKYSNHLSPILSFSLSFSLSLYLSVSHTHTHTHTVISITISFIFIILLISIFLFFLVLTSSRNLF